MGLIERITEQRKRVLIEMDSGGHYVLRRIDAAVLNLRQGIAYDEDSLRKQIVRQQYPDALNRAVAMLALRPCSIAEIRNRLKAGGFCSETADLVILKLEKEKLLDDREFSRQWVQNRSARYGARRTLQELRMKGVDDETAREAVSEIDADAQQAQAFQLARKSRAQEKTGEDPRRAKQRAMQRLIRRGYSFDIARRACDAVWDDESSE